MTPQNQTKWNALVSELKRRRVSTAKTIIENLLSKIRSMLTIFKINMP